MAPRKLTPVHPGEVLMSDFLEPFGITQYRLAHDISVPPRRINEIVRPTRGAIDRDGFGGETAPRMAANCQLLDDGAAPVRPQRRPAPDRHR